MYQNYYGWQISALPKNPYRWKWQVLVPMGPVVTSKQEYTTAEQALTLAQEWIKTQTAYEAINRTLSDLCHHGSLSKDEYQCLINSFLRIANHR